MVREAIVQSIHHVVLNKLGGFLGQYGWYILFGSILLVYGWNTRLKPWLKEEANRRAIRDAMRKERKDILDVEIRRIRNQQQEEALQISKAAAKDVHKRKSSCPSTNV